MKITRRDVLLGSAASASLALMPQAARATSVAWRLPDKRAFRVVENEWIPMKDGVRRAGATI